MPGAQFVSSSLGFVHVDFASQPTIISRDGENTTSQNDPVYIEQVQNSLSVTPIVANGLRHRRHGIQHSQKFNYPFMSDSENDDYDGVEIDEVEDNEYVWNVNLFCVLAWKSLSHSIIARPSLKEKTCFQQKLDKWCSVFWLM